MNYEILIVDDEIMMTDLLSRNFQDQGYQTYTAINGEDALKLIEKKPDIILLDINMPGTDGLELCRCIRDHVVCPILFLTARITEQDKVNGLKSGGDDYITKPFSLSELNARVEAHLRRDARGRNESQIMVSRELIIDLSRRLVTWKEEQITFSRREFDIMEFLLLNANQVFDREQIYEKVWGLEAEGDSGVVKEHIRKIRLKLMEVTGSGFIETVWGMGYKWKK